MILTNLLNARRSSELIKFQKCLPPGGPDFLSSQILHKNWKVKMEKTTVSPILKGISTCFFILREEPGLRVFEKKLLRNITGSMGQGD
jgi:hypothetical protein